MAQYENVWKGDQSVNAEVYEDATHELSQLRAVIKRDSYDFQSTAHVQVWTDRGWTTLRSWPVRQLASAGASYAAHDAVDKYGGVLLADCYMMLAWARDFLRTPKGD